MTDVVDVTDNVVRKFDALRCHASQLPDPAAMEVRVRQWMAGVATAHGLPAGRFAEGYRVMRLV